MKRKIAIAVAVAALVGGGAATAVAASGDDSAPTAKISAKDAASAALEQKPGSVESVDRDDDGPWEVEIVDAQGRDHEVRVDAESGKATLSQDDDADDRDDRDDDRDDRDDDDRAEKAVTEAKVNAEKASAAALELRPGTATEVEFDDGHWDVEVRSADGREHDVRVDSETGKATLSQDDDQNDNNNDTNDTDRDDDRNDDDTNDQDDRDDDKSDD
ncbi:PepSY domain-containing protein [Streptomyces jumonjinensis]|uniref:PepSY domain-containing protein n=1 Tax=Streptomyces jumonjinensis TaxID=1945 RepID=UPI0037AB0F43